MPLFRRFPVLMVAALALAVSQPLAASQAHLAQAGVGAAASAAQLARIDFRRGAAGAGELVLEFTGTGVAPDMAVAQDQVIVDLGAVRVPPTLQKSLDVGDFATPVSQVRVQVAPQGSKVVLAARGPHGATAYQAGNRYVVEIAPRPPAASAPPVGPRLAPADPAVAAYAGKPVSFNFQDVPVRAVLQILADEARANLVASDTVAGTVTLRLANVPWDQALDVVLRAKGLDKRRNGNVIWVAPQAEIAKYEQDLAAARQALENSAPVETRYLPISYGNAQDIAALLTSTAASATPGAPSRGFLSPRGEVSFDERTNTLLVVDIPERVQEVARIVQRLDRPVDQVVIQARIVIANEDVARELGARFGVSGATGNPGDRSSLGFAGSLEASGANAQSRAAAVMGGATGFEVTRGLMTNLPSTLAGGTGAMALSILNAGHLLDIELSAMQTQGRGEVISNPRIVTSNQKEAVITQGEEVGYLTLTGASAGGGVSVPQVQFKEALLELKVTPTITNDGRVFLDMSVQKDEVAGFVDTGVGQVPRITKRSVDTAVLMEDGQTVVIGGVYEFKDQHSLSKVPFLADIPVLGNLFKKRGRTQSKAELLIMVTPRVIRVAPAAAR